MLLIAPAAKGAFPGQNGRIAFTGGGLFTVNPDGSDVQRVTSGSLGDPAWSPDGNRLAYSSAGIRLINADGTGGLQLTTNGGDIEPTWSPDGTRIAFVRGADLFVIGVDGSGLANLTAAFARGVRDPEWSPDGTRFVLDDGFDIYVIGADGGNPVNLTPGRYGSWSPDGSRIAYSSTGAIRVVPSGGGASAPLNTSFRETWEVSWSPDGSRIAFIHDDGGPAQEQVWTMAADGSGPAPLLAQSSGTTLDWGVRGSGGGTGGGGGIGSATEPPPPPVAGASVVVREVRGEVTVRLPPGARARTIFGPLGPPAGAAQGGFVPLTGAANIPVRSIVNTTRGTVRLTAEQVSNSGRLGQVDANAGLFQIIQARARAPVTELRLTGGGFRACGRRGKAEVAGSPRRIRRLRVNGRGRFSSRGRYSSAAVRGTDWTVTDRCDGTLTSVRAGVVSVRDLVRRRTIRLRAGQRYLAAPRR